MMMRMDVRKMIEAADFKLYRKRLQSNV